PGRGLGGVPRALPRRDPPLVSAPRAARGPHPGGLAEAVPAPTAVQTRPGARAVPRLAEGGRQQRPDRFRAAAAAAARGRPRRRHRLPGAARRPRRPRRGRRPERRDRGHARTTAAAILERVRAKLKETTWQAFHQTMVERRPAAEVAAG